MTRRRHQVKSASVSVGVGRSRRGGRKPPDKRAEMAARIVSNLRAKPAPANGG